MTGSQIDKRDARGLAREIRLRSLEMVHRAGASHIGGCLSVADILAVLYSDVVRIDPRRPADPNRDRVLVSKGHAAAAVYACLAETGFFAGTELDSYCRDGSLLLGHVNHGVPGVELATGSLGHALPVGCGMALAAKRTNAAWRVFVVLSDGELDEGSNWEANMFAAQHELDNLVAIVDYNKIQSFGATHEVIDLEPLTDKWRAFNWAVDEIDGHDLNALRESLDARSVVSGRPHVVIAHTVKGKGVNFMEGKLAWHYKSPDDLQLAAALAEVRGPG